ncbi:tpr repeat-containing protein [Lasius niger]|uniref:Tpr repeat-containing protein n=1 Tax=Lasius niger TaxID=67767 RepID=A0A0J7L3B2_LASNI|nr:tpr repeat-containing protein [Lasius niger]
MGTLEDSLAAILEVIAKRIAAHVATALAAHVADDPKHTAAREKPCGTPHNGMAPAALSTRNLDDVPRRRGRPKKHDLTVSAETVSAETVSAETVSAETVSAETVSAEPSISETDFTYSTLKTAVIELANIVPDGRSKVLDIFTKHKVPGNRAQNADPSLWPMLYAEVSQQLEAIKQRNEILPDDNEFPL